MHASPRSFIGAGGCAQTRGLDLVSDEGRHQNVCVGTESQRGMLSAPRHACARLLTDPRPSAGHAFARVPYFDPAGTPGLHRYAPRRQAAQRRPCSLGIVGALRGRGRWPGCGARGVCVCWRRGRLPLIRRDAPRCFEAAAGCLRSPPCTHYAPPRCYSQLAMARRR